LKRNSEKGYLTRRSRGGTKNRNRNRRNTEKRASDGRAYNERTGYRSSSERHILGRKGSGVNEKGGFRGGS